MLTRTCALCRCVAAVSCVTSTAEAGRWRNSVDAVSVHAARLTSTSIGVCDDHQSNSQDDATALTCACHAITAVSSAALARGSSHGRCLVRAHGIRVARV